MLFQFTAYNSHVLTLHVCRGILKIDKEMIQRLYSFKITKHLKIGGWKTTFPFGWQVSGAKLLFWGVYGWHKIFTLLLCIIMQTTHMLATSSTCFWFTDYHSCSNWNMQWWTGKWCWSMSTPEKRLSFRPWKPLKCSGDTWPYPWKPDPASSLKERRDAGQKPGSLWKLVNQTLNGWDTKKGSWYFINTSIIYLVKKNTHILVTRSSKLSSPFTATFGNIPEPIPKHPT